MNKKKALHRIKQAGIMDMLQGYAPEGLGGLAGAGSAMGLAGGMGLGGKGQMISAAIGATIGVMAANKMKEHEQAQQMGIASNSMLGIENALMNLDQQQMLMGGMDPYAMGGMQGGMDPMMGGMPGDVGGMDPMMGGMDPMMGGMDPMMGGMDPMMGGQPGGQPIQGYPEAMQGMQMPQKQASARRMSKADNDAIEKLASAAVEKYFA